MKTLLYIALIFTGLHLKAQQINLREVNAPFETVYKEIQKQTDYHFAGTTELINKAQTVNVNLVNTPLNEALAQIFSGQPLSYTIYNKMVIIKEKEIPEIKEKVSPVGVAVAQQNYSISGTVSDEKGITLPGATVYITNSTYIQPTNNKGKFSFSNILPGTYEVVVTMVGFVINTQSITVRDKPVSLNIVLKESITALNAVTIKAAPKPKLSKHDLRWFFDNFIGTSANARQCKILNPEILDIQSRKGQYTLEASAKGFLEIENDALGYKIKYLLKKFIYYAQYRVCYYEGSSYFEELKGTEKQQKQWADNREKAYLGSARHFFRAAMNNTTRAEGFYVYLLNDKPGKVDRSPIKPLDIDTLLKPINKDSKVLISKPYGKPRPDLYIYYIRGEDREDQLTWVKQNVDTVAVDKNGSTLPGGNELFDEHSGVFGSNRGMTRESAFTFWGRWASQRVADLTPLDYFVEPKLDSAFLKSAATPPDPQKNASLKKLHNILPIYIDSLIGRKGLPGIENKQPIEAAKKIDVIKPK